MGIRAQNLWELMRHMAAAMGRLVWLLPLLLFLANCRSQPRLRVVAQEPTALLEVAARELGAQLEEVGYETEIATGPEASAGEINAIILSLDEAASDLEPEGFRISSIRASGFLLYRIVGKDSRGVLWGSQDLADRIMAARRLEPVFIMATNRRLPLRAIAYPLLLPEASESLADPATRADPREQWRVNVDLLARSRFNAIFLRATQPVIRFAEVSDGGDGSGTPAPAVTAHREWLKNLFRMAQDRGLDCYLWLTRASLEGWPSPNAASSAEAEPPAAPGREAHPLKTALPAILRSYPELAGVALDLDGMAPSEPSERSRWIVENVLAPLAAIQERRPIFLSIELDWQPSREELGAVASDTPIYLLATSPPPMESQVIGEFRVLWKVEASPSVLRPWEDPSAVRAALERIGTQDSVGFLDASFLDPLLDRGRGGSDVQFDARNSRLEGNWFRLLLWGRLGYSPDIPDENWVEQFARRFGTRAGLPVYLAAAHSKRVLDLLPRQDEESAAALPVNPEPDGLPDSARQFLLNRLLLLQTDAGRSSGSVVAQVMKERGWFLPTEAEQREPSDPAATIEEAARQALAEADTGERFGAWRGTADKDFHQRIRSVAEAGLAWAEYRRATLAMARFVLGGEETDRQQALQRFQTAQQMIADRSAPGSPEMIRPLERLRRRIAEAIEMIPTLRPWQWEKSPWQVGTVEGWQPATFADVPLPSEWMAAETLWLREFGPSGQQPWMAALNQQLRPAFLAAPEESPLAAGTLLVGRTQVSIPGPGQLMIRVVSNQPGTVWVNRRRAVPVSPQQSPWSADSPPPSPLRVQWFAQAVTAGIAEVVVSAPANPANAPLLMLHSLFVPTTRTLIRLNAPDAADLAGGVVFVPGTETAPQPRLILGEPPQAASGTTSQATFRFSVPEPGFYRLRLWCFWESPQRTGLDLSLDGLRWQPAVGRGDPVTQRWHWLPVETAADLGPGEHLLAITGWTPGAQVGIVEIVQQDAGTGRE